MTATVGGMRVLAAALAVVVLAGGVVWWTHDGSHQIDTRAPTPQVDVYRRIMSQTDCTVLELEHDLAVSTGVGAYVRAAEQRMDQIGCP